MFTSKGQLRCYTVPSAAHSDRPKAQSYSGYVMVTASTPFARDEVSPRPKAS